MGYVNASQNWDTWNKIVNSLHNEGDPINIAMVGKYVTLADSYVSVNHALKHAAASIGKKITIDWIDSENINGNVDTLSKYNGILVPGGFGTRGSEGIIKTANFAREQNIPYLGICFGFQLAAVSFARNVCSHTDANSTEIEQNTNNPIIDLLPEQDGITDMGGSLRLGANEINVKPDTIANKIYGQNKISKRHRHRYEVNYEFNSDFEKHGMIFSGMSPSMTLPEILEIPSHPWFIGVQFHPELKSKPFDPHPLFSSFIEAALNNSRLL